MFHVSCFTFHGKGFTLLEMLVTIGIISVIVSMGFVSYSTAQKKARDAKRKSDLKAIQNAMEQYYSICNYKYPVPVSGKVPSSIVCIATTIMSSVPKDPLLNTDYEMTQTVAEADYQICPPIEVASGKRLETEDCTSKNCCLLNQQ